MAIIDNRVVAVHLTYSLVLARDYRAICYQTNTERYCHWLLVLSLSKSARYKRLLLRQASDDVKTGVALLHVVLINGRLSARQFIVKMIAATATLLAACQSGRWIEEKLELITGNMRCRQRQAMRSTTGRLPLVGQKLIQARSKARTATSASLSFGYCT